MEIKEDTLLLILGISVVAVIGVVVGFFLSGFKFNGTQKQYSQSPSGWLIDRSPDGKASAIISLPQGIIQ